MIRDARRPGRVQAEHFQVPEDAAGARLEGLPVQVQQLNAGSLVEHITRQRRRRGLTVTGVVGSLAVRVFSDAEVAARVSPSVRALCLTYLRATAVFRSKHATVDHLLRVIRLRKRLDPLLRRAHGAWPPDPRTRGRRTTTAQQFQLDHRPWDVALALSTVWGLASRTLRVCPECALPFVGHECEACRYRPGRNVTWLSEEHRKVWRHVVFRLRARTYRKRGRAPLTKAACDRLLRGAAQETRTLSWPAWLKKWDEGTKLPTGRPPKVQRR